MQTFILTQISFQSKMPPRLSPWRPMRRRMYARAVLLDHGPPILRRLAIHRLPLHARCLAHTDLYIQLHSSSTVRLHQRSRRKTRAKATTEILAEK